MWQHFTSKVSYYLDYYQRFAAHQWQTMSPMEYGYLLIFIALCGWLLMKGSMKH